MSNFSLPRLNQAPMPADPSQAGSRLVKLRKGWVEAAWNDPSGIPDEQYLTAGEIGAARRMAPGDFARAYKLHHRSMALGLMSQESLGDEQRDLMRRYGAAKSAAWADEMRAAQIKGDRDVIPGTAHIEAAFVNGLAKSLRALAVDLPAMAMDVIGAGLRPALNAVGANLPERPVGDALRGGVNSLIGLDGVSAPDPQMYIEALLRKVNGTGGDQPLASVYRDVLRAEEMRRGERGGVQRIGEFVGDLAGSMVPLLGGPVAKMFSMAEKATVGAVSRGIAMMTRRSIEDAPRLLQAAARVAATTIHPGARFGLTQAAQSEDGQRLMHFMVGSVGTAAGMLIGRAGTALAQGSIKGAPQFTRAFATWMEGSPKAVGLDPQAGLAAFIAEGMPGVPLGVMHRAAAEVTKAGFEGLGFSAMDLGWLHDVTAAIANGDEAARNRAIEQWFSNSLAAFIFSQGGSKRWWEQFESGQAAEAMRSGRRMHFRDGSAPERGTTQDGSLVELRRTGGAQTDGNGPRPPATPGDSAVVRAEPRESLAAPPGQGTDVRGLLPNRDSGLLPNRDSGLLPNRDSGLLPNRDSGLLPNRDSGLLPNRDSGLLPNRDSGLLPNRDSGLLPNRDSGLLPNRDDGQQPSQDGQIAEIGEIQDVMAPSVAEIAAYKLALARVGGQPIADNLRLTYDGIEPPRLVRATSDGALEWKPALDNAAPWKPLNTGKVKPPKTIPSQLAAAGRVAAGLLNRSDVPFETQQGVIATLRLLASIPAKSEPGVAAALEVATQTDPVSWTPEQFDAFNELLIHGSTPVGAKVGAEAFVASSPEARAARQAASADPAAENQTDTAPVAEPVNGEQPAEAQAQAPAQIPTKSAARLKKAKRAVEDVKARIADLGPAPAKPSGERRRFGAKGAAGASPEAVAAWKAEQRTYRNWQRKASALAKERTAAENQLVRLQKAVKAEQGKAVDGAVNEAVRQADPDTDPQSGRVSAEVLAASMIVAGSGAMMIGGADPLVVGAIATAAALTPMMFREWAVEVYNRLKYFGPPKEAIKIGEAVLKAVERANEYTRLETQFPGVTIRDLATAIMWRANEQGVDWSKLGRREITLAFGPAMAAMFSGGGALGVIGGVAAGAALTKLSLAARGRRSQIRKDRRAVQWGQQIGLLRMAPDGANGYGASRDLIYNDDWMPAPVDAPPEFMEMRELRHQLSLAIGRLASRIGQKIADQKTGQVYDVWFDPSLRRVARAWTQDGVDMLLDDASPLWDALHFALEDLHNWDTSEAKSRGAQLRRLARESRDARETTRLIRFIPDHLIVNGRVVQIIEARPYEYAQKILGHVLPSMAWNEVAGQQLPSIVPKETRDAIRAQWPKAAREVREAMERYEDAGVGAQRALTTVTRALHGLSIEDRPLIRPGTLGREASSMAWLLRSLWVNLKMSAAHIANIPEPFAAPRAYTGIMHASAGFFEAWGKFWGSPARFDALLNRLQAQGRVPTWVPRFGAFDRHLPLNTRIRSLIQASSLFATPTSFVNALNSVAVALAGESLMAEWRASPVKASGGASERVLGDRITRLSLLDITGERAERMARGDISEQDETWFIQQLRRKSMGDERIPVTRSNFLLRRSFAFWLPIQNYASNAFRQFIVVSDRAWAKDLPKAERAASRRLFWRYMRSLGGASAALVALYGLWNYGFAGIQKFITDDTFETVQNFAGEVGKTFIGMTLTGPLHTTLSRALQRGEVDVANLLTQLWNSTPLGDTVRNLTDALRTEGAWLNRTWRGQIIGSLITAFEEVVPILRDARQWQEDQELAVAIQRRWELVPPDGGAPARVRYTAFRNTMRNFRSLLRGQAAAGRLDSDTAPKLLWKAFRVKMKEGDSPGAAWGAIQSSLTGMKMLDGLSPQQLAIINERMNPQQLGALRAHDAALKRWQDWIAAIK